MSQTEAPRIEAPIPPVIELVIRFDPATGGIGLRGPLQNEMLTLYLLEKARYAVLTQHDPKITRGPSLLVPEGGLPPAFRT